MWTFRHTSPSTGLFGQCGAPSTNTWEWIACTHISPKHGQAPVQWQTRVHTLCGDKERKKEMENHNVFNENISWLSG